MLRQNRFQFDGGVLKWHPIGFESAGNTGGEPALVLEKRGTHGGCLLFESPYQLRSKGIAYIWADPCTGALTPLDDSKTPLDWEHGIEPPKVVEQSAPPKKESNEYMVYAIIAAVAAAALAASGEIGNLNRGFVTHNNAYYLQQLENAK